MELNSLLFLDMNEKNSQYREWQERNGWLILNVLLGLNMAETIFFMCINRIDCKRILSDCITNHIFLISSRKIASFTLTYFDKLDYILCAFYPIKICEKLYVTSTFKSILMHFSKCYTPIIL